MSRALRLVASVAVAVALVVVLLLVLQARDRSTVDTKDAPSAAAGGRLLPDQGNAHRSPPAGFRFATDPPTSGPHRPVPIKATGRLSRDALLHALELGDVVLVYGD